MIFVPVTVFKHIKFATIAQVTARNAKNVNLISILLKQRVLCAKVLLIAICTIYLARRAKKGIIMIQVQVTVYYVCYKIVPGAA